MNAVTHLEKVIVGEVSAVTHLEKVITGETSAVTYTEKVITGEASPVTHLQRVIAGVESPVTHLEYVWAGGSPTPTEHEYTGAVPYTFTANGSPLISWRISGNTVQSTTPTLDNPIMPQGCGERTGNLFDIYANNTSNGYVNNALLRSDGSTYSPSSAYISEYLPIEDNATYTYYTGGRTGVAQAICFYNAAKEYISGIPYDNQTAITFTTPQGTKYYRCTVMRTASDTESYKKTMLNTGSTALPYEPYGYKISIICGGTITTVYIGTNPLRKSLDGTAVDELSSNGTLTQRVDTDGSVLPTPIVSQIDTPTIPTVNGSNTFDVETAVKPSEVYIKYKGV